MALTILSLAFLALLFLEVPISIALGLAAILSALLTNVSPPQVLLIQMATTASSFSLLAIPLFIFAGFLMAKGGIAEDLVALAELPLKRVPGGLGISVVTACMFFSGLTGAKVAEVAAISSATIPSLKRRGYDPAYASAIIVAASAAGELIPPAINTIVLGQIMMLSITKLFVAGILPAIVLAAFTVAVVVITAPRLEAANAPTDWIEVRKALWGGLWAIGMPIIIFGGILGGIFSPTEAAAVSVLYALLVVAGFYRRLSMRRIFELACDAGVTGGALMLLIMTASAFANILTVERIPYLITTWLSSVSTAQWFVLLTTAAIFFILGSILEGLPALIIFVPVLAPYALSSGVDPIHFAIVVIASVGVGLFLPPAGIGFITACSVGNVTIPAVAKQYIPFVIGLIMGLMVLVYVPWISLVLPALFK
jgi:C4-dicarboxylate transporter, DctM subunit